MRCAPELQNLLRPVGTRLQVLRGDEVVWGYLLPFCCGPALAVVRRMEPQPKRELAINDLTGIAIGVFFDVYNELSGFPEFVLLRAMAIALRDAGLMVAEELELPVWFRGRRIVKFKADLIVDSRLIIEVKARPTLEAFNKAQLLHYLKATRIEVGLLMNFGRTPEFCRVIYQQARNRPPFSAPADLAERLADVAPDVVGSDEGE